MNTYAFHVRHRNGWGSGFGPRPTHCATCAKPLPVNPPGHTGGTGYGCGAAEPIAAHPDAPKLKKGESLERSLAHCYKCCAERERKAMIESGKGTLYLVRREIAGGHSRHYATDWPGMLEFRIHNMARSWNNFGAQRTDVWFLGPDGAPWYGVNLGDNQILRCKRLGKGAA